MYQVQFGTAFIQDFAANVYGLSEADLDKITDFIAHIQKNGLMNVEGRNKKSDKVNDAQKRAYARQHHLWHYHIGIKQYDMSKPFGQRTSRYVLHYQFDYDGTGNVIKIVDLTEHPPFVLPDTAHLR